MISHIDIAIVRVHDAEASNALFAAAAVQEMQLKAACTNTRVEGGGGVCRRTQRLCNKNPPLNDIFNVLQQCCEM